VRPEGLRTMNLVLAVAGAAQAAKKREKITNILYLMG
jgi:hypothetical protein